MHIIIAFITALASLLYALERLGVDIGWVNPWSWSRRRRWQQQVHANPAFSLKKSMEAMALLLAAVAKIDGDISSDEKNELRSTFERTFRLSPAESSALLGSSIFLLGSGDEVFSRPGKVLEPCIDSFTSEQRDSAVNLLRAIASVGGEPSVLQVEFINTVEDILFPPSNNSGW